MNKLLVVSALSVFAAGASAGVRIENVTRDIKTKTPDGATQTMLVQDGKMKTSAGKNNSMIIKDGTIYIVDDQRKSYREMTREQMKQMASQANAAMTQMQERMKNMPPEQRAMMEKMMGDKIPGGMGGGKPDVWASKDTGKSETVDGRKCKVWNITRNGQPFEELCVVPFSTLAGKEDLEKAFRELTDAFSEFAKGMPNAESGTKARIDVNGYPVRARAYDASGKYRGTETVLSKWAEETIPAAQFDVPKGYKKEAMPSFGKN
jgi:hypothetical protein